MRIGLALSGGGARALAHVGVLKVLEELDVPVHVLAGTSMGGIVACLYAAGRSAEEIEELACTLRLIDVVQRDRSRWGFLGHAKIAARLEEALGGDLTFDRLRLPVALVAVDLETGREVVIREGSVVEGLLATTAVPIVFPPARRDGRWLIDGGALNPVPFDVARRLGGDRVIASYARHSLEGSPGGVPPSGGGRVEAVIRHLLYRTPWATMVDLAERSVGIVSDEMVKRRLQENPPDVMIDVTFKGVGLLDLDQGPACIAAGEEAARRHRDELVAVGKGARPGRLARLWRSARRREESGE